MKLTCFSCYAYTPGGCNHSLPAWPDAKLADCEKGEYEPGSDERELRGSPDEHLTKMREALNNGRSGI